MNNIFDSHAHYDDRRFEPDRDPLLQSLPQKGVRYIMNAACDIESAQKGIEMAEQYSYLYCSAGIHPHEAKDAPDNLEERLTELAQHPKVRAIGEIGLDYHYDFSPRERQKEIFERQLSVAKKLSLPVIIHDREAHEDTLTLLKKYRPSGIVHCFSGSAEMAEEIVKLGMYIGFTGVITFKNAKKPKAAAARVPLDKILLETDCPYMAPEPYRGQRCDSSMIPKIAAVIGDIKSVSCQELLDITCQNAMKIYAILP